MNEDQELGLRLRQLVDENNLFRQVAAMRGRMMASMFSEGLQFLLAAARSGDPGAQSDLKVLRQLLAQVEASNEDARSQIAVIKRKPD